MRSRVLLLGLLISLAASAPAAAHDPNATDIVQPVVHEGRTYTMRLHKVPLRGPHFEVRVQSAGGTYSTVSAGGERSFIGTVDGHPGAVSSGIIQRDGQLRGAIYFDRGATLFTKGATVADTDGFEAPAFTWPSKPTVAPGIAGATTRAWDLGVDVNSDYYAQVGSSAAAVVEQVEYGISNVRAIYLRDALLMPRLGRIVIRSSAVTDPYVGDAALGALRDEWQANQTDAERDEALLIEGGDSGGGVAYRTNFNPDYAYAQAGASDDETFDVVARHEIGHNFDISDNHAGGPEGQTLLEGNDYARLSGPELQTLFESRRDRLGVFSSIGRYSTTAVPPYAALDLVDGVAPGGERTVDVLANDHDANGQALRLTGVSATTAAGGRASIAGGRVVYRAPAGGTAFDRFNYVVTDSCGQSVTGVAFARTTGGAAASAAATRAPSRIVRTAQNAPVSCAAVPISAPAKARVRALLVKVSSGRARREGAVRVWPCGTKRPKLPTMLVSRGGRATNRAVVRRVGNRKLCIASSARGRARKVLRRTYRGARVLRAVKPVRLASSRRAVRRVRVAGRRGVRRTDRRIALNLSARRPRKGGKLKVFACGRKAPKRAAMRLKRRRSASKLVFVAPRGSKRICVKGARGVRVSVDLQGRDPRG